MDWALRPNDYYGLVDNTYCIGAQEAKAYNAKESPSNMVDFCMIIRPPLRSPEADCIDEVCKMRPEVTINHTDHDVLCKSPIVVSFETKGSGADHEKATWRGLAKCPNDLPAIPFLPGVLINGHGWSFVASAIKDGRSVLYSEVELGKTSTGFGIITTPVAP
ncbi:hypothetical protein CGCS363_v015068 [Colletotrichum siamense]|uniref:uncharacterized protein n=1 Tax=Colletotrichum siamense TaxID=690259 RepID=UPI001872334C|nr:uncharacterized protein CGCS363_v015068 [Colletotrichum siamense]KAF5483023.1 hypothetical protein CGCS363_v015068 [Colletotrichum siamense]